MDIGKNKKLHLADSISSDLIWFGIKENGRYNSEAINKDDALKLIKHLTDIFSLTKEELYPLTDDQKAFLEMMQKQRTGLPNWRLWGFESSDAYDRAMKT